MMTARIAGIGAYVPENLITNDDLAKIVDTNDEWIRTRTGIRERRISSGEGTRHLAAKAAERALAAAGVAPEELDIIILGTSSPDRNYPSDACSVQAAIGAVNAVAFDISAACAGFIFAMNIVEGFFKAGIYKTALIIGAETLSKVTDWSDRGTCVLFGDGAGAAVLKAEETGIIDMMMGADGTKGDVLACTSRTVGNFLTGTKPELGFMTMDGQEVFKFAVRKVPESVLELLNRTGTKKEDIKYNIQFGKSHNMQIVVRSGLSVRLEQNLFDNMKILIWLNPLNNNIIKSLEEIEDKIKNVFDNFQRGKDNYIYFSNLDIDKYKAEDTAKKIIELYNILRDNEKIDRKQ